MADFELSAQLAMAAEVEGALQTSQENIKVSPVS